MDQSKRKHRQPFKKKRAKASQSIVLHFIYVSKKSEMRRLVITISHFAPRIKYLCTCNTSKKKKASRQLNTSTSMRIKGHPIENRKQINKKDIHIIYMIIIVIVITNIFICMYVCISCFCSKKFSNSCRVIFFQKIICILFQMINWQLTYRDFLLFFSPINESISTEQVINLR